MKHRIPFQSVFYLAIDGEVQLHTIQINSSGNAPFGGPPVPGYMPTPGHMPMPVPGSQAHGYIPSSTGHMSMPGVPPGSAPPYASGYNAYPGQTQNSPYLYVNYFSY